MAKRRYKRRGKKGPEAASEPAEEPGPRPGVETARAIDAPRPWARWLWPLAVVLVAALVYANTLGCGFTWDDEWLILNNPRIDDPTYIRYMLFERRLWRPIKRISLMADYALWGPKQAAGFHATNVALHVGVCLTLYFVVLRLAGSRRLAGMTALLFAVHPVHVEAIANISHRKEPLSLLFYLLAFLCYLRARSDPPPAGPVSALLRLLGLAGRGPGADAEAFGRKVARIENLAYVYVFYLLGMLSKEVGAVMLPAVIVAYEAVVAPGERRERMKRAASFLAPFLVVLAVFALYGYLGNLHERFSDDEIKWITESETTSYWLVLLGSIKSFGILSGLCVWPWPLYLDRVFELPEGLFEGGVLVGLAFLALYVAGLVLAARRRSLAFLGLAWYGLNLFPVINVIPLTHWWVAERFLYVPSVGFSLLLALLLERLASWPAFSPAVGRLLAGAGLVGILVWHGGLTVIQNGVWENSKKLWANTLRHNEGSYRAQYGYGLELFNKGQLEEAEPYYRRAIEANASYPEVRYGLALLLLNDHRWEEAITEAKVYAALDADDPEPFIVIGNAEFHRRDYAAAAAAYEKAVKREPDHRNGLFNLANSLYASREYERSAEVAERTLEQGRDKDLLMLYGNILAAMRRTEEAVEAYKDAARLAPRDTEPLNAATRALIRMKSYEQAVPFLERTLELDADQSDMKQLLERLRRVLEQQRKLPAEAPQEGAGR